jgi:hypothetical protein
MIIKFHSGNESQWSVKMAGSREATESFRSCIKMFAEDGKAPTSPLSDDRGASSQPAPTNPVQTVPGSEAVKGPLGGL